MSATVPIFMPLRSHKDGGRAAEAKDYRLVQAESLGGDTYRVVSPQPEGDPWEYPTGATVFAVKVHAGDTPIVIVAPFSPPATSPEAQPAGRRVNFLRSPGVHIVRLVLTASALVMISTIALGWLARSERFVLHPADPIRASAIAGLVVVVAAVWRMKEPSELRTLRLPVAIVAAAFAVSLMVAAWV